MTTALPAWFSAPPATARGIPFWSWNAELDRDRLLRQLEAFRAIGYGGVHVHSRTGLATDYLGPEFLGHVAACVERARQLGLQLWLYDEDRWPSGYAGGLVTADPRHRQHSLLLTTRPPPPRASTP